MLDVGGRLFLIIEFYFARLHTADIAESPQIRRVVLALMCRGRQIGPVLATVRQILAVNFVFRVCGVAGHEGNAGSGPVGIKRVRLCLIMGECFGFGGHRNVMLI